MIKKLFAACALATTVALPAQADTLLGLYAGAQAFQMKTDGGFAQDESIANFDFEDETNTSFYVALEHPIPLIPNIKIVRTNLDTEGFTQLDATFTFGNEVYTVDSRLRTTADLFTTDYILYYEILDNDVVSIDVGISGKQIDGDFLVVDADTQQRSAEEFSGIIPMVYSRAAVGLPLTGLGAYVEASYLSIDDNSLSDYQAAITYNFIESLAIDMTLQAGYRSTTVDLEDLDDIYADLEFKGAFVGLEFHF
ncbi:TIGR04219 family outer membrane beta-barrel protein [Glaciecola siphonariae]|uniref:TIGR04219 family outer membrane beta-barrel protein n=1 Tax=Glaciecola siphonariae TaxID=521012 RepID=A0ABV9LZY6_9ALTE